MIDAPTYAVLIGDAREQLATLPDDSVDCVVTSPPYWGLRNYRVDGQIGLEQTIGEYVERLVDVFRALRRVLAPHGTCWLNLGDSYAGSWGAQSRPDGTDADSTSKGVSMISARQIAEHPRLTRTGSTKRTPGLKPKDLIGQPWEVAFALRRDGWWLRFCAIWEKPNPMPESVNDRPTMAHEYVFLLTKRARYYYDAEAVKEPATFYGPSGSPATMDGAANARRSEMKGRAGKQTAHPNRQVSGFNERWDEREHERPLIRNLRSVWTIPTFPYPEAHFATFPPALVERCLRAGCAREVCRTCGKPRERIVVVRRELRSAGGASPAHADLKGYSPSSVMRTNALPTSETVGWTDCGHGNYRRGVVLDPFAGSGTTLVVARRLGLDSIGIELNQEYVALIEKRMERWWDDPRRVRDDVHGAQLTLDGS